jgi:hypothetical protein
MIERDYGVVVEAEQNAIQGNDLLPVGRFGTGCLIVHRGDCSLELVRPSWPKGNSGVTRSTPSLIASRSQRPRSCTDMG